MVRHFHETEKPIFTICHGVQILVAVDGVVKGKRVGALGACEPEVRLAGGTYVDLSPTESLIDGTMVSAKGWTALAAFMRDCLKVLGTEIRHGEVAHAGRDGRGIASGGRAAPATFLSGRRRDRLPRRRAIGSVAMEWRGRRDERQHRGPPPRRRRHGPRRRDRRASGSSSCCWSGCSSGST